MRLSNNYVLNFCNIIIAICFVFFAVNSAQAQTPDEYRIWTTVGSAGTVDETDISKVSFDHGVAQIGRLLVNQPAARKRAAIQTQTQSAVIRYNVTPVDGLFPGPPPAHPSTPGVNMTLRYLVTGSNAQVVAKLIEVDLATGVETVRLTFNSKTIPATNGYQVNSTGQCEPAWRFDFKNKAYYIEATLTSSSFGVGSAAAIQVIKIDTAICRG